MYDLTELNRLFAATTQGEWRGCAACGGKCRCGLIWSIVADTPVASVNADEDGPEIPSSEKLANREYIARVHNAWPTVSARLALLEEFVHRVEASRISEPFDVCDALDWLEAETKKAAK